jgi:hypothetical protein
VTPDIINAAQNLQQCRKHIQRFQDLMNLSREGNKALYHKSYKHRAQWIQSAFQAEQELIDAVMAAVFAPTPEPAQPAPQEEFNFLDAIKAQAAQYGLEILSVEVDGVQGPIDMAYPSSGDLEGLNPEGCPGTTGPDDTGFGTGPRPVDDTGFAAEADRLFTDEIMRQIGDETKGQK